jgi:SAM-dependent methyltransferase
LRSLPRPAGDLRNRYTVADLGVLNGEETKRYVGGGTSGTRIDLPLAWELLYRVEPELYDRLADAERLHPGVLEWLPDRVDRIVEVGAGTGRLTLELLERAREIVAIEPAASLRQILIQKLRQSALGGRARVTAGFFDDLPLPDDCAALVVTCSALTPEPEHGGDAGLAEMERVCAPGGCVAVVWPNNLDWLAKRGYKYVRFPGEMFLDFSSLDEAVELTEIFYPDAAANVRSRGQQRVPFEMLGINPPRDIAFKAIAP